MKSRNPKQPRGLRKRLRREFSDSLQCFRMQMLHGMPQIKSQWLMHGRQVGTFVDSSVVRYWSKWS